ncbi:MAG: ABC transporter substrate-binding protein [Rhizobiaceae bacterium]
MKRLSLSSVALAALLVAVPALAKTDISIGLQQEPTSLDPTTDATASIETLMTANVYEQLTLVQEDGEIVPQLAEGWEVSEDGLTYVFSLREGVTFHDGSALDADTVKFSFDRAMGEDSANPASAIFEPIESVTVIDPLTVEIVLSRPEAFFLFNMASGKASIMHPDAIETNASEPMGSGPFRFASWTRGDRLVLEKNQDHRDADDVTMERVTFRFFADPAAATAAMMSEEIDAFPGFPAPELLPQFEADPRFVVNVGTTEGEVILAFNNSREPFNDIRVRRALSHLIDRQAIIDGAMYGLATPIGSFYPPHHRAYVDLTDTYPVHIERARELLAEAGLEDGLSISLRVPPFPYATRSAEIIQSQFAQAGVEVTVENVEWSFWLDEVYSKLNYDMTIIAHTAPNDLGNFARGPSYFYGYDNAEYSDLWERIRTETDADTRDELTREAQRFLADEAVHGFLFQLPSLGVARAELTGFRNSSPVQAAPLAPLRWQED